MKLSMDYLIFTLCKFIFSIKKEAWLLTSCLPSSFYETLRLYPSVPGNQKYALEDDIWPDGTVIKAGYYVTWNPYAQGRSTKVWGANAKEFYPERWIDEDGNLRRESAGKWPAFHAGPRICLGKCRCYCTLDKLNYILIGIFFHLLQ